MTEKKPEDDLAPEVELIGDDEAVVDDPAVATEEDTEPTPTEGTKPEKRSFGIHSQLLVAVLMAALGFGIVVQVRQIQTDDLAQLRQDDLVQLLDEVTRRNQDLTEERSQLRLDRSALQSGTDQSEYLRNYSSVQQILAGTVPVHGPGVEVNVDDPQMEIASHHMVHMLEELRNAGAEAVSLNGVRLIASSYFLETPGGIIVDGELLKEPYRWKAIGNAATLAGALDIPGGALAGFRTAGATVTMVEHEDHEISAVKEIRPLDYATPTEENK